MSEENVELVEQVTRDIEDFLANTGESEREAMLTRLAATWHPEIEWDASELPLPDLAGVVVGREATRQWWHSFLDAWDTTSMKYALRGAGHRVVVLIDQRMRGRSTGIEVALGDWALLDTFDHGMVVQMKLYLSQAEALEAAGLSE